MFDHVQRRELVNVYYVQRYGRVIIIIANVYYLQRYRGVIIIIIANALNINCHRGVQSCMLCKRLGKVCARWIPPIILTPQDSVFNRAPQAVGKPPPKRLSEIVTDDQIPGYALLNL